MMAKKFKYKQDQLPKRIDFPDGSAIINYEGGGFAIIESCSPYGEKPTFYKDQFGIISMN